MNVERSLVLIKPDGVLRGRMGLIIDRFEKACLKIAAMKLVMANDKLLEKHYADNKEWKISVGERNIASYKKLGKEPLGTAEEIGEMIRLKLIEGLKIGPVVAMVIEGNQSIAKVRSLVGNTNPIEALPGTIRGDLSSDDYAMADDLERVLFNLIHASDSVENANNEIKLWFNDNEIFEYGRTSDAIYFHDNNKGE